MAYDIDIRNEFLDDEFVDYWRDNLQSDSDSNNGEDHTGDELSGLYSRSSRSTPIQRKKWQKSLSLKEVIFDLNQSHASGSILKPTGKCYSRLYTEDASVEEKEDELKNRGFPIILDFIEANKSKPVQNFFDSAMEWAQDHHKLPALSGDAFAMNRFQLFCATNTSAIMHKENIQPKEKTVFIIQDATKTVLCFLKDAIKRTSVRMHLIGSLHEGLKRFSRADHLKSDYCMLFETLPGGRYDVDPTTQLIHVYKYCCTAPGIANVILCLIKAFQIKRWDEGTLECFLSTLLNAEGITCIKATSIVINQVKCSPKHSACQKVKPDILYSGKVCLDLEDKSEKEHRDVCDALLNLGLDDPKPPKTVCISFPFESIMVVMAMDKDIYLGIRELTSAAKTYHFLRHLAYMARIYILSDVFSSIDIMELSAYCHHHFCGAFDVNEV